MGFDFWDSVKETGKALGDVAYAPAGAVIDLASAPFDDEDDNFGTLVSKMAGRASAPLDLITSPENLIGGAFTKTMEGATWALDNAVNRPIGTALTMGTVADVRGGGAFFDSKAWADAYKLSDTQNAGQSFAFMFHEDSDLDPLAAAAQGKKPYDIMAKEDPIAAASLSWGANILGAWYLDPFVLASKAASITKAYTYSHKLGATERAGMYNLLVNETDDAARLGRQGAGSRFDRWLDWTEGKNAMGRELSAPEILYGTPELRKYAPDPQLFAGLIADANKIGDAALRRDAKRRIMAVAAGDTSQISRLHGEMGDAKAIADTLRNQARKSVIDLDRMAENPLLEHNPQFIAALERQLDNINNAGDSAKALDKFVDGYNARLGQILDLADRPLSNLPGIHAQGKRAINRLNDQGAGRALSHAGQKLDDKAANYWAQAQSASSVFQAGRYTVPFVMVKTVGMAASPWTKFPVAAADALRQTHFTGVANLHDWGGSTTQLDSMMKLAGVEAGERMKVLGEAYLAKSEPEKMRIIERIEGLSMNSLARTFSERHGADIDRDFIEELMIQHSNKRNLRLSHMRGRSYAATEMPDSMMAMRGRSMAAADDAVRKGESSGHRSQAQFSMNGDTSRKWRVDQINDDGTLLSLPLLDTQLGNTVPLIDIGMAKTLLERDQSYMSRLSKAWKSDALELERLSGLKAGGATGIDRAIEARRAAMDWSVHAAQKAMRVWKFSVLFRLGYPLRVLTDDHWRIWTQINAGTFYADNGKEMLSNWRYNQFARRDEGRRAMHSLKVRRQEILDELEGDRMVAHPEIHADFSRLKNSVKGHKSQLGKLRTRLEGAQSKRDLGLDHEDMKALRDKIAAQEAAIAEKEGSFSVYHEQLGEYGPDDLKKELETIESEIRLGTKAHRPAKRTIGTADVQVGDYIVDGAFTGAYGHAALEQAKSNGTFEYQVSGVEDRMLSSGFGGSHRTIQPDEPGHADAWAIVLNHQFRQSPVAMHFIKGGDVDSFVRWIKEPEQATLRERVSHFAHDPEDWGHRVQALVHDYIPNDELMQLVAKDRVSTRALSKMFQDPSTRPAVHGRVVADNLGNSERSLGISKAMNRVYKWLGEMPTDHLSRHPFFNSMYKHHLNDLYEVKKAGYALEGKKFGQADVDELTHAARRLALHDLKRTLFDISAHSHAAHVMRFVSPFFAAHQETIARWWRIVGDDPTAVRRFTQVFDLPRQAELVVDENGELVKPGEPISRNHRLLLQLPKAFGGPETDIHKGGAAHSKWQINENSFNIVLQGGLTNPGVGPLVTLPVEYLAQKYADEKEIARVARVFNPFPPTSPVDTLLPATAKRADAILYGRTGVSVFGVGAREYNTAYSQNVQDLTVDFMRANGREPNKRETDELMLRAGRETNVDMFSRLMWNATSPAPAQPRSKYSAIQHGWRQIADQARRENKGYDWAYAQFKAKWGDVYMPLVYSSSNSNADLSGTSEEVAGIKRYRGVLDRVDPTLTRMVIGPYADDANEYSPEARNFLKNAQMKPGNSDTYITYDDPAVAAEKQMARRGWQKYGELTSVLTAIAQQMGLKSYNDSDQLLDTKAKALERLREENWAFNKEWNSFDRSQFDRQLEDMGTLVNEPALIGDTERTEFKVLGAYLALRKVFMGVVAARAAAGGAKTIEAEANADVRKAFAAIVGQLVESNTYFEEYMFNGTLERDPMLEVTGG